MLPATKLSSALFADDLYEHAFVSAAVELAVEDLLPGAKVEFAICNCHDDFTAHYLSLVMRVAVVFAGAIVMIAFRTRIETAPATRASACNLREDPVRHR
jgi:hypothetical protein